jgi:U2-associated protein SR140
VDADIDGVPLENADSLPSSSGFVKSKWEELDPSQVAEQAITTSKWEFDPVAPEPPKISSICNYGDSESDSNSESDTEQKRKRLREIEIKLVEYQDELDSGKRQRKPGYTMSEQVEHYRIKLLRKVDRHDSDSSERYTSSSSKRDRSRRSSSSERRVKKKSRQSPSSERERHPRSKNRTRSRSQSPAAVVLKSLK